MSIHVPDDGENKKQRSLKAFDVGTRILQTSRKIDDECDNPKILEQDLFAAMTMAKRQCMDLGIDIPVEEFDEVVGTFMQLFTNKECWVSLCDGIPSTETIEESHLISSKNASTAGSAVAVGSAVAIAMLIVSLYCRRNRTKEAAQDVIGQKYLDGWEDGESSYATELTAATGGDREIPPSKCFFWQGSLLSVNLDTLSEEQSISGGFTSSYAEDESSKGGSLVYSTTSGENGD
jgi:hypothetical protein